MTNRIIAKLGYGAYSTVWLARDERTNQYSSVKVSIEQRDNDDKISPVLNEVTMLRRMKALAKGDDHPGLCFTRLACDIFQLQGSSGGSHYCIVSKPQRAQPAHPSTGVSKRKDISPINVLIEIADGDDSSFKGIGAQESANPSIPIISELGVPVYPSRHPSIDIGVGIPILTDLGSMRDDDTDGRINQDWIMPDLYRALEVLLQIPWIFQVDMWSVGVMTLELLEGRNLFDPIDHDHNQYVLPLALAHYIVYLGPPPMHMLEKSPLRSVFFDENGNWTLSEAQIPKTSLEDFVTTIPPGEEKDLFLKFIRKMLAWDPEARATSNEIMYDAWLHMSFEELCFWYDAEREFEHGH
ncbi:kinase-like domain-containing protein [Aspergillus multicolor]|uniref:kinase-like domain-containing protein n=1 Tax=Aspergillus multicolor TaxID=41759 RepID=UPI003CCDCEC4